jgi:hypothetical protein
MPRLAGFFTLLLAFSAQAEFKYSTPKQIGAELRALAGKDSARLQVLAKTPGGRDVWLLSLGEEDSKLPAVLVVANMEGNSPLATEAALELSRRLLSVWKDDLKSRRWYILPVGNPDGYANFFTKPLFERNTNDRSFNDDYDDKTDEDGPEDLNRDGFITRMRQAHPEGEWMPVEKNPVLMKKADPGKGEKGVYRVFTEGIDDDRDGLYNEDGPGGTNPGRNFPHSFTHYTKTDGPWAASEPASRAVLRFAYDHPEIGMLIVFGNANSLEKVPEGKKPEAAGEKYKVPEKIAKRMGLDPDVEYPLEDLVQMGREHTGYKELTAEMVLQFLGVGAASKPDQKDLTYWNEVSKRYQEFIEKAGLEGDRLDPPGFPPGSVDEWGYYQYGVPTFSLDFWTLPVKKPADAGEFSPDKIEKMTKEEFIALGREKIDTFIKKSGAPAQFNAEMVIKGLERIGPNRAGPVRVRPESLPGLETLRSSHPGQGGDRRQDSLCGPTTPARRGPGSLGQAASLRSRAVRDAGPDRNRQGRCRGPRARRVEAGGLGGEPGLLPLSDPSGRALPAPAAGGGDPGGGRSAGREAAQGSEAAARLGRGREGRLGPAR